LTISEPAHANPHIERAGTPLHQATGVVVLLHGRGASAHDILGLAQALNLPGLAFLAPQAVNSTWYPNSFMAPRASNEPWLTSALEMVHSVVDLAISTGLPTDRIALTGFSQGACLATEFIASHPARFAGLLAFTGGLIGEPGANLHHPGSLSGTPVFFGSGDPDPHVPWSRIVESAAVLTAMDAQVTTRRYPGRPPTPSPPKSYLSAATSSPPPSPKPRLSSSHRDLLLLFLRPLPATAPASAALSLCCNPK